MKLSWRSGIALVIGGVVLGSIVSVAAQDEEPSPSEEPKVERAHWGFKGGLHGGLIRSESVHEGEEDGAFVTVRTDRGVLQRVDGGTLQIEEADGETVEVATNDDTEFYRDGEEVEIGDMEEGDHLATVREKEGDADFATTIVKAISAEAYAELEEQRQACEDDPAQCPRHGMRGPGMLRRGDIGPAPEPSSAGDEMAA